MSKETDESQSGTIEMNEIPNEKGTSLKYNRAPPYGVPFGPCLKTRLISIMSARQGQTIDIEMVLNDGKMGINCLNDLLGVKK